MIIIGRTNTIEILSRAASPSSHCSVTVQAVNARLEALEEDDAQENALAPGSDDEEFTVREDSDGGELDQCAGPATVLLILYPCHGSSGEPRHPPCAESIPAAGGSTKKRKLKTGSMRKTRGMVAERARGPKLFRDWLEEVGVLAGNVGPRAWRRHFPTAASPISGVERRAAMVLTSSASAMGWHMTARASGAQSCSPGESHIRGPARRRSPLPPPPPHPPRRPTWPTILDPTT